ncbi:hypothetical protein GH714_004563 [Hevea brasiliensis]|uniref:Thaumatin-like protein n=1 Tax=Hevea brasiliensis TaxID=3981 RepID=A0A6A6KXL3_HEVBR|nr:hypothetical protein GH714_004563 [Hevea brasiliensis]
MQEQCSLYEAYYELHGLAQELDTIRRTDCASGGPPDDGKSALVRALMDGPTGQNISTTTKTFTLLNNCKGTIWPGVITKGDSSHGAGFTLNPGQTAFYNAPTGWSGRIWARTGCNFDKNGTGSCQTGSCGTSLNCSGPSSPPNTIAEFTLGDIDFYDVSLVDGFNLPIVVQPLSGKGNCSIAGCDGDVRNNCPTELSVRSDGKGFKQVCPAASSYAFDRDATSIITCSASDYIVTFCASRNQTFCSYHDNKVMCNATNSSKALPYYLKDGGI